MMEHISLGSPGCFLIKYLELYVREEFTTLCS